MSTQTQAQGQGQIQGMPAGAVSRSYRYRKLIKPLLERKRRARINKCLDDLKQLIMEVVQLDEETLTKLEKADILELTVHHLHGQRHAADPRHAKPVQLDQRHSFEHFWCGFQQCIVEVSRLLQIKDLQLNVQFVNAMQQLIPARPDIFWRPWELVLIRNNRRNCGEH